MTRRRQVLSLLLAMVVALTWAQVQAGPDDWPQWRGPNRDNKVTGFTTPANWPKTLTQKWKTPVGIGDASPVLVGDKVYAFTRLGDEETLSCLDAGSGKVAWQKKYAAKATTGAAKSHPGPRSTPAVAEGKVCTLGVWGAVYCFDAATGNVVWHKDTETHPQFFTASSPIIADGKCIAYVGNAGSGAVVAYDLASGAEKWTRPADGPPYGSFALMTVDGTKQLVTPTEKSNQEKFVVGIGLADGKLLWRFALSPAPRYNNGTPIIDGQTVIFTGQGYGTAALKVEKQGDGFAAKELWKKTQSAHQYNTPVLKDGLLYGLAPAAQNTTIYCMDAKTGDELWTDPTRRGQCGTILDAGPVLVALTSDSNLVVFKPSKSGYEELAKYKVADTETWAYPLLAGNRVFVKDRDSVILWAIE